MSALLWGLPAQGFHLFRRVGDARPFEPPTYRAEAQSLVRLGKIDLALAMFEVALGGRWDQRFGDFHQIIAVEYGELLRHIASGELKTSVPDFVKERFAAVSAEGVVSHADLVVMITWNTDGTDVDLHVTEPSGEECFYGHRGTRSGGQLTKDVTQGYGPEMYVLPSAPAGRYQIRAHYFAADRNRAFGPHQGVGAHPRRLRDRSPARHREDRPPRGVRQAGARSAGGGARQGRQGRGSLINDGGDPHTPAQG